MENQNVNDIWSHAISAESILEQKSRIAELEYVKKLFDENLPVGTDTSYINEYFNDLEQKIVKNEPIKNEEFPPERDEPDPESGKPVVYKYYSTSLLKHRAQSKSNIGSSNQTIKCIEQQSDLEYPSITRLQSSVQDQHQES